MANQACSSDVHLSIKLIGELHQITIWLNLIPSCTELVDVFLLSLFFQLVLGTRFIQKSHMDMTLVLIKKIILLEIRKS